MSSFVITTPETRVTLSPPKVVHGVTAGGTANYSVTNQTGGVTRARLRIDIEEGVEASWFSVREGSEQDIGPGATASFSIDLSVPGATTSAQRSFKAVVVNLGDPDNDFAVGPAIAFEQPALKGDAPSGLKWWMIAIPVGLLVLAGLGGGLFFWLNSINESSGTPEGPVVVENGSNNNSGMRGVRLNPEALRRIRELQGKTVREAQKSLEQERVAFVGTESPESKRLRRNNPKFDALLAKRLYRRIVISPPKVTNSPTGNTAEVLWHWKPVMVAVPIVVDKPVESAIAELKDAGFEVKVVSGSPTIGKVAFHTGIGKSMPAGTVIEVRSVLW